MHVEPGGPGSDRPPVSDTGPRLGFYSSGKYHQLESLCWHLSVTGRPPRPPTPGPDGAEPAIEPWVPGPPTRHGPARFAHLGRAHHGRTFMLPLDFADPIEGEDREEVSALISAPAVVVEAELLRFVMVGVEAEDWRWWERQQRAEAHSLAVADDPTLADAWAEALDLAWRLHQFARQVIATGAMGHVG